MTWLIALIRAWLGLNAEIKQKQQQEVGIVKQQNSDLTAAVKILEEQNKALTNEPSLEDSLRTGKF
jgi:hypothetical protein